MMHIARHLWCIVIASAALFALTTVPAFAQDSTLMGELPVVTGEYHLGDNETLICHPDGGCGQTYTEITAHAYVPDPSSAAVLNYVADNGPMPLVMFVHGRHHWCYNPGNGDSTFPQPWPCAGDYEPIPSHRGYDYIARVLASHGYHVVSIATNAINQGNTHEVDRASLMEMHLNLWSDFNAGTADGTVFDQLFASDLEGLIDLQRIGTMGHSRGGAGVVAHQDLFRDISPYRVQAVLPIAPTASANPLQHTPLGLMMADCDGDLFDLAGLKYFDGSRYAEPGDQASKHTFLLQGANHNYANTVWTPECWDAGTCPEWDTEWGLKPCAFDAEGDCSITDDDFIFREQIFEAAWEGGGNPGSFPGSPDVNCSPFASPNGRLTPTQQRQLTLAYTAAFFRYYIGGEAEFGPVLRGDEAAVVDTGSAVRTAYHPPSLRRSDVHPFLYDGSGTDEYLDFLETGTGGPYLPSWLEPCGGFNATEPNCFEAEYSEVPGAFREAHTFSSFYGTQQLNRARLTWDGARELELPVISGREDIRRYTMLQFRAGYDYADGDNPPQVNLTVELADGSGNTIAANTDAQLGPNVLQRPAIGSYSTVAFSHTVRLPLSSFTLSNGSPSFDDSDVVSVRYILGGSGETSAGTLLISDTGFSGEQEDLPSDIVMVLDISGSMDAVDFQDVADNRLQIAVKGVRHFAETLTKNVGHRVALVPYSTDADPSPLSFVDVDDDFDPSEGAGTSFADKLDAILAAGPTNRTSIGDGLHVALEMLVATDSLAAGRRPAVLLFTDGRQNESRCIGLDENGSVNTENCTPDDPLTDIITQRDPRLADVPICSIGLGRTAGQVDERLLEAFSSRYLDSQPNGTVPTTSAAQFAKCIPELSPQGIAIDPDGILARNQVSAPAYTYESAGDQRLTFVSSWSNSVETAGDMRLFVNAPNGDLVVVSGPDEALRVDYHNQFVAAPQRGPWRFQLGRDLTRVVNAFTSDSFSDVNEGVQLVRRQIQHLCPEGCDDVLYFEDGRVDASQDSVYALALTAEQGTGLLGNVDAYDASDATSFAYAVGDSQYDLIVYIHQLETEDPVIQESYDSPLVDRLCGTGVPALVTDTRATLEAASLPYQLAAVGGFDATAAVMAHACSGALVNDSDANYSQLVDTGGTLISGSIDLVNRGYDIFSYGVTALPWDEYTPGLGASQLDATTEAPAIDTTLGFPSEFGSVVTHSADQVFVCAASYGAECYNPRDRDIQRWATQVNTRGYAPLNPVVEGADVGDPDGVRVKFCLDRFLPVGGIQSGSAFVEVVHPTADLADVLAASTCQGDSSPSGDDIPGDGYSVALEDIPVTTTTVTLTDDGAGGDAVAGDLCYSAQASSLGQYTGTYTFRYFAEFDFVDDDGTVQTIHREEYATQYIGDEVLANGRLCTPTGGTCDLDTVPPVIDPTSFAPAASTCSNDTTSVQFQAPTAADDCGVATVNGMIIASSDSSVSLPLALVGGAAPVPPGTYTIEWVAFDTSGNASAPFTQTVEVQPALVASGNLFIRNGSSVFAAGGYGAVANGGNGITEIGNDATVGGIDSVANVKVWHRAAVFGDLTTTGLADVEPTATVHGVTSSGTPVSISGQDLSGVTFPVTSGQLVVNAGETLTLSPGEHPTVYLNSQSHLILEAGDHFFEQLHVNTDSVVVDAPNGTRLFVRSGMSFRAPITVPGSGALSNVFLAYDGSNDLVLEANFSGTVIAPDATVRLGTSSAQAFSGAIHAESIDLSNGANFTCVPSSCIGESCEGAGDGPVNSCEDGMQNGDEEGVDCGGSCPDTCPIACQPETYEAETMYHSTGGSTSGGWNIWANGYISTDHDFSAGQSVITVTAKGQWGAGWPHMVVTVDGSAVGDATVNSPGWTTYSFPYTSVGGEEEIRVIFDNDYNSPPWDRNLLVDKVDIECP